MTPKPPDTAVDSVIDDVLYGLAEECGVINKDITDAKAKLKALMVEARIDDYERLIGWIARIHYQPVDETDRWVQAAGEIMAEIEHRKAALTAQQPTGENK